MRPKLFALALAAMLTIGTGGVIAADSVSPADVSPSEQTDDPAKEVDDNRSPTSSNESYDKKLTADKHTELEPTVVALRDDGVVDVSVQEPIESDWTDSDSTIVEDPTSSTPATRNATVYDEKLTAEESITVNLSEEDVEMIVVDTDTQDDEKRTANDNAV